MTELEILRKISALSGKNQNQIAGKTGIAAQTVNAWFKGNRKPKLSTLLKISNALEVEIEIKIKKA